MILEFITKKPTNAGAWRAINKLEFTLVQKVLLWVQLTLTYDFKSLKKDTLNIIDKDNIAEYTTGLIDILKQELDITIIPKIEALPISKPFGTTYDECLMGIIEMIYSSNSIEITNSVVEYLHTGKDVELTNVINQLKLCTITPVTVSILHSTDVFFEDDFRKYFIAEPELPEIRLTNESYIRPYLTNKLLNSAKLGGTSAKIPTIKLQ